MDKRTASGQSHLALFHERFEHHVITEHRF